MQKIKITQEALKKKLEKGDCKFSFTKLDGTIREANGTTRMDNIPEDSRPKGGTPISGVAYYDSDSLGWRSIAENQEVTMDPEDMMEIYSSPKLSEEEVTLMIWVHLALEDKWLSDFMGLVVSATSERATDLCSGGFLKLVRVIRKYGEEKEYASEIRDKWYKLISE